MAMTDTKGRTFAVAGVVVAAVLAAALALPAARQLGSADGTLLGAAILGVPVLAVLAISGYRHYGAPLSVLIAAAIAVITVVVTAVCAVAVVASALSGSGPAGVAAVLLVVLPAVVVLVLGLGAAFWLPRRRSGIDHGRARVDGAS
jgi:hypothetical protein